jgi:hypothetical protein
MPLPRFLFSRWLAGAILAGAVLLGGKTLQLAMKSKPIETEPTDIVWSDVSTAAPVQATAAGRYATGRESGDRILLIGADGGVQFGRIGLTGERIDQTDRYRTGRRGQRAVLVTSRSGVIDVQSIDAVRYYGDDYRRVP